MKFILASDHAVPFPAWYIAPHPAPHWMVYGHIIRYCHMQKWKTSFPISLRPSWVNAACTQMLAECKEQENLSLFQPESVYTFSKMAAGHPHWWPCSLNDCLYELFFNITAGFYLDLSANNAGFYSHAVTTPLNSFADQAAHYYGLNCITPVWQKGHQRMESSESGGWG